MDVSIFYQMRLGGVGGDLWRILGHLWNLDRYRCSKEEFWTNLTEKIRPKTLWISCFKTLKNLPVDSYRFYILVFSLKVLYEGRRCSLHRGNIDPCWQIVRSDLQWYRPPTCRPYTSSWCPGQYDRSDHCCSSSSGNSLSGHIYNIRLTRRRRSEYGQSTLYQI